MPIHLIHILSGGSWGGREQYALDICLHFLDQGWNVSIFTRDAIAVDSIIAACGIKIHHAALSGYSDFTTAFALAQHIRRRKGPIVVHTHNYRDAFLALVARKLSGQRRRVKVIMTRHRCVKGRNDRLLRRVYRNLDTQIFPTQQAMLTFLSSWPHGNLPFPKERIRVIGRSLLNTPTPQSEPEKGPIVAAYVGRLAPHKGLEYLIRALVGLKGKRIRLRIAGTGAADYVDSLHRLAMSLGVTNIIDWKGWRRDPLEQIADSHFCVFPTPVEEPQNISSLQVMAAGRPQISTLTASALESLHPLMPTTQAAGATPEVGNMAPDSILVPARDVDALAKAMLQLATDPALRSRLGEAARQNYLKLHPWNEFIDTLTQIYTGEQSEN